MRRFRQRGPALMRLLWTLIIVSGVLAALALVAGWGNSGTNTGQNAFVGTDGALLYQQGCAACHGSDLRGSSQGPPFLHQFYVPGHHGDQAFFAAALTGVRAHHWNFGDMPRVEGITESQILAIVTFVRERQREAGFR
jgi:mono/diheme cytochrome c family protein